MQMIMDLKWIENGFYTMIPSNKLNKFHFRKLVLRFKIGVSENFSLIQFSFSSSLDCYIRNRKILDALKTKNSIEEEAFISRNRNFLLHFPFPP